MRFGEGRKPAPLFSKTKRRNNRKQKKQRILNKNHSFFGIVSIKVLFLPRKSEKEDLGSI
jgi:hypothetical protein